MGIMEKGIAESVPDDLQKEISDSISFIKEKMMSCYKRLKEVKKQNKAIQEEIGIIQKDIDDYERTLNLLQNKKLSDGNQV